MLRSRYRWLLFNRNAGGSIGGGFASFLCLKRLSVLSCLVRSTSTTFRSSIFNSTRESRLDRFIVTRATSDFFVTLHHGSSHCVANYSDNNSLLWNHIEISRGGKEEVLGMRKMSFVLRYRANISVCYSAPICNRDPFNDTIRSRFSFVFFLSLIQWKLVVISRWCDNREGIRESWP